MKKIFKNSFMALAVLALGFSACTEEDYTPAEMPSNDQVFFSNTVGKQIDLAMDAKSFDIVVNRTVTGKNALVPVTVTADSSAQAWFEFPDAVEFADTMKTAVYTVAVKEGVTFEYDKFAEVSITIAPEYATPYGDATYSFKVGVPAPWSEWEEMSGVYNFALYVSGAYPIPVYYREHLLDDTKAQFLLGVTEIGANEDITIDYNKSTGDCQVGIHYFLDNANYGPVFVSDFPHNPFDLNKDGERETYEDHPCTYDSKTGLFTLELVYFVHTGLGSSASGTFGTGVETIQLDGFTQYDYSLTMNHIGNYVDNAGTNNAVINVAKGADVKKFLMTVVSADEDADAAVQGMLAGTVPCDTLTESGYYAYPIATSGNYMALAITFDAEDKPVEAHSTNFEFWVAGDSNPWESLGYAKYTDDVILPLFGNPAMSYYVEVLENKEQPGLFRMVDPYGPEQPLYSYAASYEAGSYIEIDATDPQGVWIEGWQNIGLDIQGAMSITSMAWYQVANEEGATKEDAKAAGLCGTYADGVITFPADGILIALGGKAYYGNRNAGFALDMTNLLDEIPAEEGGESAAPAARMGMKFQGKAMGKVSLFKKVDNSCLVPTEMPLVW